MRTQRKCMANKRTRQNLRKRNGMEINYLRVKEFKAMVVKILSRIQSE